MTAVAVATALPKGMIIPKMKKGVLSIGHFEDMHVEEFKGPPWRAFFNCAPGRAHPLGGASPLHARQGEVLAERQLRYCEVSWEGSRRQSAGPTNRNRIGGLHAG